MKVRKTSEQNLNVKEKKLIQQRMLAVNIMLICCFFSLLLQKKNSETNDKWANELVDITSGGDAF